MPKFWKSISLAILILIVLLIPKSNLPENRFLSIKHFDKIVHAMLFAGLEFLLLLEGEVQKKSIRKVLFITLVSATYAGLTELLQVFTHAGRTGSYFDFLADMLGIVLAILIFRLTLDTKFQSSLRNY